MITDFLNWLSELPPALLLVGAGLLVFGETSLGLGFIAPGETGLFILGTTANTVPKFLLMWLVTTACAIAGYSIGYWIGKTFGPKLRNSKIIQKHGADGWDKSVDFLQRRGVLAVMGAIFLPVMRTLVPVAAGAAGLPFRKFLPAAAVAGTSWCALHIGIGAAAGESAKWLEETIGKASWIVLAVVVAIFVTVMVIKKRRKRAAADEQAGTGSSDDSGSADERADAEVAGDNEARAAVGSSAESQAESERLS